MTRADRLARYLDEVTETPWSWALSNCLSFGGDWVGRERGEYDADVWRGACDDEASGDRLLRSYGGPDTLFAAEAECAGLEAVEPDEATAGDLGLIRIAFRDGPTVKSAFVACIRTAAGRWAIRTKDGVAFLAGVTPQHVWKV